MNTICTFSLGYVFIPHVKTVKINYTILSTCKGLFTNAPPCPALRRAALRRALRLVDLVADWLIPEVLTNQ